MALHEGGQRRATGRFSDGLWVRLPRWLRRGKKVPLSTPERLRFDSSLEGKLTSGTYTDDGQDKKALFRGIAESGRGIYSEARDVVACSTDEIPTTPSEFTAGFLSVGDLVPGVEYPTADQIFKSARDKGFKELSVRQALIIIAKMTDQPKGDALVAGHKPVSNSEGRLKLLVAEHAGDEAWLRSGWPGPYGQWGSRYRFAFLIPE